MVVPAATPADGALLGHAWGVFIVALLVFCGLAMFMDENGNGTVPVGYAVFAAIAIGPWAIWILNQDRANRVLPVLALVILVLIALTTAA